MANSPVLPLAGLALLSVCILSACERPRAPAGDSLPAPATTLAESPPSNAPWRVTGWFPHDRPVADFGQGVLAPARERAEGQVDTLVFRTAPASSARAVGYLLVRKAPTSAAAPSPDSAWEYAVAARDIQLPNLVEFGYEIAGIPFDSTSSDGIWVRGLLGTNAPGRWITGWANASAHGFERLAWASHLREEGRPLFFREGVRATTAETPGGAATPIGSEGYILYATDTVRGRWLRARLVAPSDYCTSPDTVARRERLVWVEYLDARGRPRMWYHSRGC